MSLEKITDLSFVVDGNLLKIYTPANPVIENAVDVEEIESDSDTIIEDIETDTWECGLLENSQYTVTVSGLTASDGTIIPTMTFDIITPLTPMYCSLTSVISVVNTFNIPKKDMLLYIREASEECDFIEGTIGTNSNSNNDILFSKKQFVKTKVVLDCMVRSFTERTTSGVGSRYKLDVAEIEEKLNEGAYKAMIADLRKDLLKWQDAIRGYYNEGRAAPKSTRFSLNQNLDNTTVDKIIDDFSRTMPTRSDS